MKTQTGQTKAGYQGAQGVTRKLTKRELKLQAQFVGSWNK
jgi:hypothetical protein